MQINRRAILSLIIGLSMALLAVVGISRILGDRPERQAAFEVASVVVAAQDLTFGAEVNKQTLAVREWPKTSLPEGSFATVEDVLGDGKEPRVVLRPLVAGEVVLPGKISGFGERATMSAVLPEGKRAFTIRVNDVSGVAGFLLPGDRVDVLLTRQIEDKDKDKLDQVTDVILQNIVVRGIDQSVDQNREKPQVVKSVTVEATTEETQKLALAQEIGQLSLALRNVAANDTAKTRSVRLSDLVGAPAPAAAPKQLAQPRREPPPLPSVVVRRGVESQTVTFQR